MVENEDESEDSASPLSRRKLLALAGVSAGAAVAATTPGLASAKPGTGRGRGHKRGLHKPGKRPRPQRDDGGPDRFGRMFGSYEPSRSEAKEMRQALIELSRPGGVLDANDPLEVGPVRLITEPELSPANPDNPRHTAGTTFLGQFLDHDITRDGGSTLGRPTSLRRSVNLRSARFDLDSVYGGGPAESPDLYEDDRLRFVVESGGQFEDLPRDEDGAAIIADPRNDENLMISGLHAAFLKFHNGVVDRHVRRGRNAVSRLTEAQRVVRWHYQWIVLHEFLPLIVGQKTVNDVLRKGRLYYTPRHARIPVEFQVAAYRFGHSMVRPSYRANLAGDNGEPFFAVVFDPAEFGKDDPEDLTGGHRAPRRFIDWQTFFDFGDGEVKPNKKIDTAISTPLFRIPTSAIDSARGEQVGPTSLSTRNLLRRLTWQMPPGQRVAQAMHTAPLTRRDSLHSGSSEPVWTGPRRSGSTCCVKPSWRPTAPDSAQSEGVLSRRSSSDSSRWIQARSSP